MNRAAGENRAGGLNRAAGMNRAAGENDAVGLNRAAGENRVAGRRFRSPLGYLAVCLGLLVAAPTPAQPPEDPQPAIEEAVQILLDEFSVRRAEFESDPRELFALVERVVVPLFDLKRISRLVLATHGRQASPAQREAFGEAFKKLLIGTYATALFKYTGDQKMTFTGSKITERKGRKFAVVNSEVSLSGGSSPVAVVYALILDQDDAWKIYNLTIDGINLVINYRNAYAESIASQGLDGVIESMQASNAKLWP